MDLDSILTVESVIPRLKASSKKQALQELARKAAEITGLEQREVFDCLLYEGVVHDIAKHGNRHPRRASEVLFVAHSGSVGRAFEC